MNSWMSTLLGAWAPPFRMFIMGTGSTWLPWRPRYFQSGMWFSFAAARATAIDTARIEFAPSLRLLGVPSRSMSVRSTSSCSRASNPRIASLMGPPTFSTALSTPLPP
jgi:hypothetical protein